MLNIMTKCKKTPDIADIVLFHLSPINFWVYIHQTVFDQCTRDSYNSTPNRSKVISFTLKTDVI